MRFKARWAAITAVVGAGSAVVGGWAGGPGPAALAATSAKPVPVVCTKGASTLTVQGSGSSSVSPDQMVLTISVHTQSVSAKTALASNAVKTRALINSFEKRGVPARQLQTAGLDLQPNYDNSGNITSYGVDDTVTATVNNLTNAGAIIDAAVAAVGNSARIENVSFAVQHQGVALAVARAAAVRQAANLATQMAKADGLSLGSLCSLQDNSQSAAPPEPQPLFANARSAAPATTPVQAGTEQFYAQVTATYELVH